MILGRYSHCSDSSSFRQGFHEAQSQLLFLFRKSPVFGFLQRAWKAAARRAYVRESCSGARACVQRACGARRTGFGAGWSCSLSVRICQNWNVSPRTCEFRLLPIRSLHIFCAPNVYVSFVKHFLTAKIGNMHSLCKDPFDQLWLLIFLSNDLLHIVPHDGLIVTPLPPAPSARSTAALSAWPGTGPACSRGWWPNGELRPS